MEMKLVFIIIVALTISGIASAEEFKGIQFVVEGYQDYPLGPGQGRFIVKEKVWQEGRKIRLEGGDKTGMIRIRTENFGLQCSSEDKACYKGSELNSDLQSSRIDYSAIIDGKLVGTEVIRGYPCDIYERELFDGYIRKIWVWKDKNFIIQLEFIYQDKVIGHVEHKDIKYNIDIDDKLFEVPEGFEVRAAFECGTK